MGRAALGRAGLEQGRIGQGSIGQGWSREELGRAGAVLGRAAGLGRAGAALGKAGLEQPQPELKCSKHSLYGKQLLAI